MPVALEVWRDGVTMPFNVVAVAEPQLSDKDLTVIGGEGPLAGAVVADLSSALADRLHVRGADSGAVIVDVQPLSAAERVGFQPGDVVLKLQGKSISSVKQALPALPWTAARC